MAKLFETWITINGVPSKVYAEIEGGMFKYGIAPANVEMEVLEFPVTNIQNDTEVWVTGNKWAGARFVFRDVKDNCGMVKLQVFVVKHRKTVKQKRTCW